MSSLPSKAELRALSDASVAAIPAITWKGQNVLTTELLAQLYDTDVANIRMNYLRNSDRFDEGVHFFKVAGKALADLRVTLSGLQISAKTRSLMLWTERGAARHAKMIETDEAWGVFAALEDHYFKKIPAAPAGQLSTRRDRKPLYHSVADIVDSSGMLFGEAYRIVNAVAGTNHLSEITLENLEATIPPVQRIGDGTATQQDYARVEKGMIEIYGEPSQLALPLHDPPGSDIE